MAWGHVGAVAGAKAMHAKHKGGSLTAKQLAAARRNVAKKRFHKAGNIKRRNLSSKKSTSPKALGKSYANRTKYNRSLQSKGIAPLGVRYIRYHGRVTLKVKKPTGRVKRFVPVKSPGSFYKRTSWSGSRKHTTKTYLARRKPRMKRLSHWSSSRGGFTPR